MDKIVDKLLQPVTSDRRQLLAIIATCEEMLHLARKGEWTRVAELESRRSQELVDFFSLPMPQEVAEDVVQGVQKVSDLNEQLVDLATQARNNVCRQSDTVRIQTQASREYSTVMGKT